MVSRNFTVHVAEPELVSPEKPIPHEFKYLSNIDDQLGLRNHFPIVHIYRLPRGGTSTDPARLIRRALSHALMYYYPLAGRLRHTENGKLVVECTGEGILFREADADATIEQLRQIGTGFVPPFSQWDRLLVDDVYGSLLVTDSPLLRMQVTRFACGGFVLAYTVNHCACDAAGVLQFITAVAELARNPQLSNPSLIPVWSRELLIPRNPPCISFCHYEYENPEPNKIHDLSDFHLQIQSSLFLPRATISTIKTLAKASASFDAVAALLWRSRTRVIGLADTDIARLLFAVDIRHLRGALPLPKGYYGAAIVSPSVSVPVQDLCQKPLSYAASKIAMTKYLASQPEYRSSVIDYLEVCQGKVGLRGGKEAFAVSDHSKLRYADVDFGWGRAMYGGPGRAGTGSEPGLVASVVSHRLENGEEGLLLIFTMASEVLEAFHGEVWETVAAITEGKNGTVFMGNSSNTLVRSAL
ncbi:hypothetical protein LUZ61_015153 [Rhynchospora tenuis]|uniref:Uncharacterized protein n=1 Tax=Rhynchospora tenuis TaxID=198213 RepID=A0AAD5Z3H9_9POAL|nr:hypothetical protein LUZ61_015153 [Rhynchospora tenuis]